MEQIINLIPLILVFTVFYVFLIRPQEKKKQELMEQLSKIKIGDEVLTNFGVFGTISKIEGETFEISTSKTCSMKIQKSSIHQILNKA